MDWYKFDPLQHRVETFHLGKADDLCYRFLMDHYYVTEKPLTADVKALAKHIDMDEEVVQGVLEEFFTLTERGWEHERIQRDIDARLHRRMLNRRSGKMGGRPKSSE